MPKSHYKTLEVDPKASKEVISAAYRTLAANHSTNDRILKRINAAYEVVGDDDKRSQYDKMKSVGKKIGGYRILEAIAEGGFGVTYKAKHEETGGIVCIKHASNVSSLDEQLLIDEANACWDLRHWGIPCMRDILRFSDGSLGLVMSYIEGATIGEILQMEKYETGLDPEHVAWMTERILNTMKYLHLNGVIHGDIKPQNIIIQNTDHTAVLVDYGLSLVKPKKNDGAKGYTPFFAAPEQAEGKPLLPEADFYGLGMTMIFALGGDVEHIKVPDNTPDAMCGLIKKFIKRNPLSRPNWSKEDLCDTIAKIRKKDFKRRNSGMKPLEIDQKELLEIRENNKGD